MARAKVVAMEKSEAPPVLYWAYVAAAALMIFPALRLLFDGDQFLFALLIVAGIAFTLIAPFYWKKVNDLRLSWGLLVALNAAAVAFVLGYFFSMSSGPFDFTFWLSLLLAGVVALYGRLSYSSGVVAESRGWPGIVFMLLTYLISPILMAGVLMVLPDRNAQNLKGQIAQDRRTTSDVTDLKVLSDLHEAGKLSDEEFSAAKRRIIGSS